MSSSENRLFQPCAEGGIFMDAEKYWNVMHVWGDWQSTEITIVGDYGLFWLPTAAASLVLIKFPTKALYLYL